MKRTKPVIKVDGASLIIYPDMTQVNFPEGQRDLVEFKVNISPIQRAISLRQNDSGGRREEQTRQIIAAYIDRRIEALQALKTQVLLGSTNLLDTDTEDT